MIVIFFTCKEKQMNPKIESLIKQFAKLPRVGGRAAQRIVLSLLQDKKSQAESLSVAILDAVKNIKPCPVCGILTGVDNDKCEYCLDAGRENGALCIVRDLGDVWTLEKAGVFFGRYQILGGLISGMYGITPDDLNIKNLSSRIVDEKITEIIFALPNTIEGKTTAHYIISSLQGADCKVQFSELASGVPLGGDLDYLDEGTLSLAFNARKKI